MLGFRFFLEMLDGFEPTIRPLDVDIPFVSHWSRRECRPRSLIDHRSQYGTNVAVANEAIRPVGDPECSDRDRDGTSFSARCCSRRLVVWTKTSAPESRVLRHML